MTFSKNFYLSVSFYFSIFNRVIWGFEEINFYDHKPSYIILKILVIVTFISTGKIMNYTDELKVSMYSVKFIDFLNDENY